MPLDTDRLQQIFDLEHRLNYSNSAVIGGLDKFLAQWMNRNSGMIKNPQVLTRIRELWPANFSYASLNATQRQTWMRTILALLTKNADPTPEMPPTITLSTPPKTKRISSPRTIFTASVSLESPITVLKGISAASAAKFKRLGVTTVRNLLYYFPFRHLNYADIRHIADLSENGDQTIIASIWESRIIMPGGRRSTEAILGDETGNMRAVWFNNPWLVKQFTTGTRVMLSGRVKYFNSRPVFESPDWEIVEGGELTHTGRLVPVYPLTAGLFQRQVRKLIKYALDAHLDRLIDFMPENIMSKYKLMELKQAVYQSHFPDDESGKRAARIRLAFDELLILQLGVLARKRLWQGGQAGIPLKTDIPLKHRLVSSLPFNLTAAQIRVTQEIEADLSRNIPMSRLLQGEVGSGKTVVALSAILTVVGNGYQGTLMAPTEILAEQHHASIIGLLENMGGTVTHDNFLDVITGLGKPIKIALLMGDTKASAKTALKQAVSTGEADIVIGTHALIQKGITFKRLALVVIDEQHRFGVEQRSALRQKGYNPHMLVMTATPIPRTLALTIFGDLDLSVIDELPAGRSVIKTKWIDSSARGTAYRFLKKEVDAGHQAYIICPLVEESESLQAKAAVSEYSRLSADLFPEFRLGLLHGRLPSGEKERVMKQFKNHELDILVSTSVVEVGIDVANASVMMVESADRFGLSQLHQFRGRVGRGKIQSYCMLLADNPSDVSRSRLDIIEQFHDGFKLADEDLKLRGPGEFFGTRQSGLPDLRMARLSDVELLEAAREAALSLSAQDPEMSLPQNRLLAGEVERAWREKSGERS